ncbi:protein Niban isoform X2 [Sphaeramia orbicularis]|uniref:protein Niban isoform X2 n=1 Tax=Sphaeramia orbicularis TaxID=375764 RepID=UPI00117F628E|nr:protein Niban isoform X2 [Sphaeramia orbicularis]
MGVSGSSLLDEAKSSFIKGQVEAELKAFSPFYRTQFSVTRFRQLEEDLEQNKDQITQLLKQRDAPEGGEVLYEEAVLYFDDTRKWRERYVVVRANYCLECHDSLETFLKGVPARHKLLPTGGSVLTTEEKYMVMVDKCFPDDTNVKEDFAPPLSSMPGQFPVYLRLPYRRDSYFCFRQQAKQDAFLSIMSDCIRHQNQDFLKKKTCEVQAFLKAIRFYRQVKGHYEAWDMLIGSDVRVMANLVMEQLLPSLEKDLLPRLKAKKTEKKRVWFATVEAAYVLVQEHLLEGLSALKDECRTGVRQQEQQIHSDMEAIISSRRQLEQRVRDKVSVATEQLCAEMVQPYLGSVLDELMEPISSGFQEGRHLSETLMDQVCQDVLKGGDNEQLKKALFDMSRPNLLSCYQKMASLQEKLQLLQDRFGFSNVLGIIHSAQIDLQQLMENAAFTFEQLLNKALMDHPDNAASAIEKNKHRVLKQYDYDSSSVRKRILQEALVSITLPFIKRRLDQSVRTELQDMEQFIFSDHTNFIHMENVYEDVLLQILDKEVNKVVKEAASLRKFNLITDSRDLLSESSRSSLSSPSGSTPSSPAMSPASAGTSWTPTAPQPPSPLVLNGVSSSGLESLQQQEKDDDNASKTGAIETPLGRVELKDTLVQVEQKETLVQVEQVEDAVQTPKLETNVQEEKEEDVVQVETVENAAPTETVEDVQTPAENLIQTKETVENGVQNETVENIQVEADVPVKAQEVPSIDASETPAPETEIQMEAEPEEAPLTEPTTEECLEAQTEAVSGPGEEEEELQSLRPEAPPGGPTLAPPPADQDPPGGPTLAPPPADQDPPGGPTLAPPPADQDPPGGPTLAPPPADQDPPGGPTLAPPPAYQDPPPVSTSTSDPNSLDVSVGSESPPSDVESLDEAEVRQSSEDEVSTTSDRLEEEPSKSPVSSDPEETARSQEATQVQSGDVGAPPPAADAPPSAADAPPPAADTAPPSVDATPPAADAPPPSADATPPVVDTTPPVVDATPPAADATPLDCIKEIRDLVVEVIEVEELVQRYPSGIPKEEEQE